MALVFPDEGFKCAELEKAFGLKVTGATSRGMFQHMNPQFSQDYPQLTEEAFKEAAEKLFKHRSLPFIFPPKRIRGPIKWIEDEIKPSTGKINWLIGGGCEFIPEPRAGDVIQVNGINIVYTPGMSLDFGGKFTEDYVLIGSSHASS